MKTLDKFTFKNATTITMTTLVGVIKQNFPLAHGNCFSVECDDKTEYRIVNFVLENLEQLIKTKQIEWPVKILPISERQAVVVDERIPEAWFNDHYCETCCSFDLLPHNQQMQYVRKLLRKDIEEFESEDKKSIYTVQKFKPTERKLDPKWKIEVEEGIGMVYAPYIPKNLKT